MLKNKNTTLAGIVAILTGVAAALTSIQDGSFDFAVAVQSIMAGAVGLGLVAGADGGA